MATYHRPRFHLKMDSFGGKSPALRGKHTDFAAVSPYDQLTRCGLDALAPNPLLGLRRRPAAASVRATPAA